MAEPHERSELVRFVGFLCQGIGAVTGPTVLLDAAVQLVRNGDYPGPSDTAQVVIGSVVALALLALVFTVAMTGIMELGERWSDWRLRRKYGLDE